VQFEVNPAEFVAYNVTAVVPTGQGTVGKEGSLEPPSTDAFSSARRFWSATGVSTSFGRRPQAKTAPHDSLDYFDDIPIEGFETLFPRTVALTHTIRYSLFVHAFGIPPVPIFLVYRPFGREFSPALLRDNRMTLLIIQVLVYLVLRE
jgi:hypothetical protein